MIPKEKAESLVDRMYFIISNNGQFTGVHSIPNKFAEAKKCALLAVDEIIKSREEDDRHFDDTLSSIGSEYYTPHPMYLTYWLQVKQEIEKL
jgi:hypothetical protein